MFSSLFSLTNQFINFLQIFWKQFCNLSLALLLWEKIRCQKLWRNKLEQDFFVSADQPTSLKLNDSNTFHFQPPVSATNHIASLLQGQNLWNVRGRLGACRCFFFLMWQRIFICLYWNSTEAACGSNLTFQIKVSCVGEVATKLQVHKAKTHWLLPGSVYTNSRWRCMAAYLNAWN